MKRSNFLFLAVVFGALFLFAGCGVQKEQTTNKPTERKSSQINEAASPNVEETNNIPNNYQPADSTKVDATTTSNTNVDNKAAPTTIPTTTTTTTTTTTKTPVTDTKKDDIKANEPATKSSTPTAPAFNPFGF